MKSIKYNFIYSIGLTASNLLFPLITYPYIARILGPEYIGVINFATSFITYFVILSSLGINIYGQREIARESHNQEKLSRAFNQIFGVNIIAMLICLIAYLSIILNSNKFELHKETYLLSSIYLFFYCFSIEWFFRGIEYFKFITIRTIIIRSILTIVIFIIVKKKEDYNVYYLLTILTIVIPSIINIYYSRKFINVDFIKYFNLFEYINHFRKMIYNSTYTILTSLYTIFPIIFLGFYFNDTEIGYYSLSDKIYKIFISLFTSFTMVIFPRMSYLYGQNNMIEFNNVVNRAFQFVIPISITCVILGINLSNELVYLLGGKEFSRSSEILKILMPALFFVALAQILAIQVLLPLKKDKEILIGSIIGAVIGGSLIFYLGINYGPIGISYSVLCAEIFVTLYLLYTVKRFTNISIPLAFIVYNIAYLSATVLIVNTIRLIVRSPILITIFSCIITLAYLLAIQIYLIKNSIYINLLISIKHKLTVLKQ